MKKLMLHLLVPAFLLPPIANADQRVISDANDVGGYLDIKTASAGHTRDGLIKHTVTMFGSWESRELNTECGSDFFNFNFNFRDINRKVTVEWQGKLVAKVYAFENTRYIGTARVWRPGDRTVVAAFKRWKLGRGVESYRWQVHSGSRYCRPYGSGFDDYAPDLGHWKPEQRI